MELKILDLIQKLHNPVLDWFMCFVTGFGNFGVFWLLVAVVLMVIPRTSTASTGTMSSYRSLFGYEPVDLKFRAAALNSGAFFLLDPGMIAGMLNAYFPKDIVEKDRRRISAEYYITEDFLPCYLSTANEDFIHDQTIKLAGFLTARGVEHVCRSYGDKDNPQPHVFLMNQKDETARQCNEDEVEFFREHMG
ncbi:alpha/beta hydrolase [Ligilactobacillus sp.]|uniref:alpha/beta hydrolase n=1 Tax=Ligilactobacillus sp. TaxID=2767921 RepID=UPI002FE0DF67